MGGLPLVTLEVEDVFWAVLEDLDIEDAGAVPTMYVANSDECILSITDRLHAF